MSRLLALVLLLPWSSLFAKQSEAFLVTVGERKIEVTAPGSPRKKATVVIKNATEDRIVSELRSGDQVLARFVLEPSGGSGETFTYEADFSGKEPVEYAPIAPPFQEVPLKFSKESYEVP